MGFRIEFYLLKPYSRYRISLELTVLLLKLCRKSPFFNRYNFYLHTCINPYKSKKKKKLFLLPSLFLLLSCNNDDDSNVTQIIDPTEPNKENIYFFTQQYKPLDFTYYKGPNGAEYPNEANSFFEQQWSFYRDPSIKSVELKNDSLIINENLAITKYKYKQENGFLIADENDKKITLAHVNQSGDSLKIYKNFQTFLIISDKSTNEIFHRKAVNYGKLQYDDVFPFVTSTPQDLTSVNEYIFWCNLSYSFKKK